MASLTNRPHLLISVTANDSGLRGIDVQPAAFAMQDIAVCGRSDRVDDMDKLEIFFDYV